MTFIILGIVSIAAGIFLLVLVVRTLLIIKLHEQKYD